MKKRNNPFPRLNRREATKNPTEQQPEDKENVFTAFIGTFFEEHPLLFGLICGYLLRMLSRLLLGF